MSLFLQSKFPTDQTNLMWAWIQREICRPRYICAYPKQPAKTALCATTCLSRNSSTAFATNSKSPICVCTKKKERKPYMLNELSAVAQIWRTFFVCEKQPLCLSELRTIGNTHPEPLKQDRNLSLSLSFYLYLSVSPSVSNIGG